jgi:cytochrome c biogenesis protein CcmG, thiol:disulfide interchange protein DsbE
MIKIYRIIPLALFLCLFVLLYKLLDTNPTKLPSVLVGREFPIFQLPALKDKNRIVTKDDLRGDIVLLNVWGTWCAYCKYEHKYLMELAKSEDLAIYGLNYRDERSLATQWLNKLGNPYRLIIFDQESSLAVDLGVYGAPETFVIDHNGIIRMRFTGVIDSKVWVREFVPVINEIKGEISVRNDNV